MNLRALAESDLSLTLEGDFGMMVNLIGPDGIRDDGLSGQVLYDTVRINPDTGEEIVVDMPVVTLRRSSLARIPVAGENWIVEIPETPRAGASMVQYAMSPTRSPEAGKSIGFIRIYLQAVEQSA